VNYLAEAERADVAGSWSMVTGMSFHVGGDQRARA
jgi:hypothetical protein